MMFEIIESLTNILGPIATASKENSSKKDRALRALSYALDKTCLYYRDLRNGILKDREREAQLVRYWSAAAIPLRHFDSNLAEICDHKSEYWLDPENYDDSQIDEMGIRLEDVRNAYRQHLKPNYS
ncbi:hypothetical protein [Lacinutrix venerupis]|uniref:Uncharacterized protein n=1 Tax=Lacinutrix venerupis TaxID=1486034 RepID=A0AAC9PVQ3_9FLAO|nr:hypothetical protein [Lacinutrix venerupis]APX99916.1 hypothetical protein BWR22_06205 [Lacinutrix venerupis]